MIKYKKKWTTEEKIKRDIAIKILLDFDDYRMVMEDKKQALKYFIPYLREIGNLSLQKKFFILAYKYAPDEEKKQIFYSFLEKIKNYNSKKGTEDIKKIEEFLFRALLKIDEKNIINKYVKLLQDWSINERFKYLIIERIIENKDKKYSDLIISFYKKNFPPKLKDKDKDKDKDKNIKFIPEKKVYPFRKVLSELNLTDSIEKFILDENSNNYLKLESLKVLDKIKDKIKNKKFLIRLFDNSDSLDIKKEILKFFYSIKYTEIKDFIFRLAFSKGIQLDIKFEAYKILGSYENSTSYLKKIFEEIKNLSQEERINAIQSFVYFSSHKKRLKNIWILF